VALRPLLARVRHAPQEEATNRKDHMNQQTITVPAISRALHYIPVDSDDLATMIRRDCQPLHATVIMVLNERTVNLAIIDHDGMFHTRIGVRLVHPGDELPGGSYAVWPAGTRESYAAPASVSFAPAPRGDSLISPLLADALASAPPAPAPSPALAND
jgi:hypothetical protein